MSLSDKREKLVQFWYISVKSKKTNLQNKKWSSPIKFWFSKD